MALDSNKPIQRVHNGQDGIWDGAAWGLGAGAIATGMMYGATIYGSKHLANLADHVGEKRMESILSKADRKKYSDEVLTNKLSAVEKSTQKAVSAMGNVHAVGRFSFGSGKRAMIAGSIGLLGGMVVGAGLDAKK